MISTKLYSLVLITLFGLIVFNSLEYAAGGDDEVAKTEGEKTEEVKADEGHKCEGDNCTTCTDNSKTEEVKDDGHKCEGDNCTTCKGDSKAEEVKDNRTTYNDDSKTEKQKEAERRKYVESAKAAVAKKNSNTCTIETPGKENKEILVKFGPNGEVLNAETGELLTLTKEGIEHRVTEEVKKREKDEEETRKECINILKKFNFNGVMTHDAFEVDFKIDNPGDSLKYIKLNLLSTIELVRSKEEKEKDTSQNYKMHINYLVTKVISTETDLLDYYCNKIDPLFRLGFRGDYNEDMELEQRMQKGLKKQRAKIIEDDMQAYLNYLRLPQIFDYVSALRQVGVYRTNLIYKCAMAKTWFKSHVPPSSKDCKEDKISLGYNGNLLNDNNVVGELEMKIADLEMEKSHPDRKKTDQENEKTDQENEKKELPEYALFVKFLTTNNAPSIRKDFVILYCEIIDALRASGFTGKKEDVKHEVADKELNAELVNGYTHFIKLPGKSDGEDDLRFKYTLFRISVKKT